MRTQAGRARPAAGWRAIHGYVAPFSTSGAKHRCWPAATPITHLGLDSGGRSGLRCDWRRPVCSPARQERGRLASQPAVACGYDYTLALKKDGSLWAWGSNYHGVLGFGNGGILSEKDSPTRVGLANNWAAVACGFDYSLALRSDGSLWAWGDNKYGQLGLGNTVNSYVPARVGTDNDWAAFACGFDYTLALKKDGSLWAWGENKYGQLGLGNTVNCYVPTRVGTDNDWETVAGGGGDYTLALKKDGSLWAWGRNKYGQLGLGDTAYGGPSPTRVGSENGWAAVACNNDHSLALKRDGSLWAWGLNDAGQLGLGDDTDRHSPTQVGMANDWAAVACGVEHTLALKKDGSLWAWGDNGFGALGLGDSGSASDRDTPTRIGVANDWAAVAGGDFFSLALKKDGSLWAWGENIFGSLGVGDDQARHVPTLVTGWSP